MQCFIQALPPEAAGGRQMVGNTRQFQDLIASAVTSGDLPRLRDHEAGHSFLSGVVIDHGPKDLLAELFQNADTALRQRGLRLGFSWFDELMSVNKANSDSWRPILPVFNPEMSEIKKEDGFVVIGRNAAGEAVTTHAFRMFDLGTSTLKDEIESQRIFYADPETEIEPGESIQVSAPTAEGVSGSVVFSGAVWIRPDYRRADLLAYIQPLVRGACYGRWGADFVFSFMAPELVRGGVARKGRFPHVEWEVKMTNTPVLRDGVIHAALVFTTGNEQIEHFHEFMETSGKLN